MRSNSMIGERFESRSDWFHGTGSKPVWSIPNKWLATILTVLLMPVPYRKHMNQRQDLSATWTSWALISSPGPPTIYLAVVSQYDLLPLAFSLLKTGCDYEVPGPIASCSHWTNTKLLGIVCAMHSVVLKSPLLVFHCGSLKQVHLSRGTRIKTDLQNSPLTK